MKFQPLKITLLLALFSVFFTDAYAQTIKSKVKNYGSTLSVQAKGQEKEVLAEKTHAWLQETLDISQFNAQDIDVADGKFFGLGSFTDSAGIALYELALYAKDNNIEMVFNVTIHKKNPETNVKLNDNYLRKKTQQHFQNLAKDLEAFVNKQP